MGRPRKPAALRELEGCRSHSSPIPNEPKLDGLPQLPPELQGDTVAAEHFLFYVTEFGPTGILKEADGPALAKLAILWSQFWKASAEDDAAAMCKLSQRWDAAASKLGLTPVDRAHLVVAQPVKADPTEERFFKVTG